MKRRLTPIALATAMTLASTPSVAALFDLTIFHNNDGESRLLPEDNMGLDEGGIAQFVGTLNRLRAADTNRQLTLSSGDNFLPGSIQSGGFNDDALGLINYDAIALGNHEFDLGPNALADFINDYRGQGAPAPFLSANLDFSAEANLQALVNTGAIAASTTVTKNGQTFGIVGATTENLGFISSPGNVLANAAAPAVQAQVDALENSGVNKIILISHLQGVAEDRALISQVRGVDIAIAGGGDDLLQNDGKPDATELLPGDPAGDSYPIVEQDLDGEDVYVVTTGGGYDYIGRLTVTFDEATGKVQGVDGSSGPVRIYEGDPDVTEDGSARTLQDAAEAFQEADKKTVVAATEPALDARSDHVRSVEANIGNLIADALRDAADGRNAGTEPLIALMNSGGIRTNTIYNDGDLTRLEVQEILPFSNTLAVVEDVTTRQLVETLENAVSRVIEVDGKPERSGQGTGRFAQVSGLEILYDLRGHPLELDKQDNLVAEGNRILSVALSPDLGGTLLYTRQGGVLVDMLIDIATLSFTAGGGDQYFWSFSQNWTDLLTRDSELLIKYLEDVLAGQVLAGQYPEAGSGRVRFQAPVPATLGLMLLGLAGLARART